MEVKITEDAKKYITLAEYPMVKRIVNCLADDEMEVEDYAKIAMGVIACGSFGAKDIRFATAEISKNRRVMNAFEVGSNNYDVWIEFECKNYDKYYFVGCFLTDIWDIDGDHNEEFISRCYIEEYVRQEIRNHDLYVI